MCQWSGKKFYCNVILSNINLIFTYFPLKLITSTYIERALVGCAAPLLLMQILAKWPNRVCHCHATAPLRYYSHRFSQCHILPKKREPKQKKMIRHTYGSIEPQTRVWHTLVFITFCSPRLRNTMLFYPFSSLQFLYSSAVTISHLVKRETNTFTNRGSIDTADQFLASSLGIQISVMKQLLLDHTKYWKHIN